MKKKVGILLITIFLFLITIFIKNVNASNNSEIIEEVNIENEKNNSEVIDKKAEIKGNVQNPGVYIINENDRIIDFIDKAGGLKENSYLDNINLSKKVIDEMMIFISTIDEIKEKEIVCQSVEEIVDNTSNEIENKLVNINNASIDELQTLDGIGKSKAESIIRYRENFPFKNIEDLKEVSGIGESLFEKIKDNITI